MPNPNPRTIRKELKSFAVRAKNSNTRNIEDEAVWPLQEISRPNMTNRTEDVWYLNAFFLIQWAPLENFWQWTWKWWFSPQRQLVPTHGLSGIQKFWWILAWGPQWPISLVGVILWQRHRSPTCGVYSQWPFLISRETVRWRINKRVWILQFFCIQTIENPVGCSQKKWWYEKNQHDEDVGPAWIHFPTECFLVQAFGWVPSSSQKVL